MKATDHELQKHDKFTRYQHRPSLQAEPPAGQAFICSGEHGDRARRSTPTSGRAGLYAQRCLSVPKQTRSANGESGAWADGRPEKIRARLSRSDHGIGLGMRRRFLGGWGRPGFGYGPGMVLFLVADRPGFGAEDLKSFREGPL